MAGGLALVAAADCGVHLTGLTPLGGGVHSLPSAFGVGFALVGVDGVDAGPAAAADAGDADEEAGDSADLAVGRDSIDGGLALVAAADCGVHLTGLTPLCA